MITIEKGVFRLLDSGERVVIAKIRKIPSDGMFVTTLLLHAKKMAATGEREALRNRHHRIGAVATGSAVRFWHHIRVTSTRTLSGLR